MSEKKMIEDAEREYQDDKKKGTERANVVKNWDDEPSSPDAWKLMYYRCESCGNTEHIWNARPHVTPFGGIPCSTCPRGHMTHIDFGSDQFAPDHRPVKGDLIFIDTPPEIELIYAKRLLDEHAGSKNLPDPPTPGDLALSNLAAFGGHSPSVMRLLS